ncbi:M1 family metallopeptidase [Streptomyces sp. JNUCC 64]
MPLINRTGTPRPSFRPPARTAAPRTGRALLAVATAVCLVAAGAPAPVAPLGVGDRLFPHLGNPGYDVHSYEVDLVYTAPEEPLTAVTRIDALATARLERFHLDFADGEVRGVEVGGVPARFTTTGEDLVVTPAAPVPLGGRLDVTVRHTSEPARGAKGWIRTADGLVTAPQPDGAHHVFPCNDHPSDKAGFTFRVTTPGTLTAVTNGLPAGVREQHGTTTRTFRTVHPMATELVQVSIGDSSVVHRAGPRGLPLRDVVPRRDREALEPWLRRTPDHLVWMAGKAGDYPFETYGVLAADADTGFALETQTLSLFARGLFLDGRYPDWYVESIMVHELAHQWFGNSVGPRVWSDLWLNEGHATWYEALWADEHGHRSLDTRMRDAYRRSDGWREASGPPAAPEPPAPGGSIFRPIVYDGAALVLYALRQEIGHRAFERLERLWTATHRDSTATTRDFADLASAVAGRDLSGFLDGWLYGRVTPPMPGHPEWSAAGPTAEPVSGSVSGPAPGPTAGPETGRASGREAGRTSGAGAAR